MKKTYTKPVIIFESFLMSTSIAAGCEAQPQNQTNYNSCGIDFGGYIVFAQGYDGCGDMKVEYDTEYGSICYHIPDDNNNIFNS